MTTRTDTFLCDDSGLDARLAGGGQSECARGRVGAPRRRAPPARLGCRAAPPGRHRPRRHRRNQEGLALEGPDPRRIRPRLAGPPLPCRRRSRALRAHRRALLPGQPAQSGAGFGCRAAALPAQGLHGRRVPDRRGPRPPRRRHPAHRRRAHRCRAQALRPGRALALARRARRGAHRRRAGSRPDSGIVAGRDAAPSPSA